MVSSLRPIQLSQFESIFDATFISYCSTAAFAILWPIVAGWLIASIMASPASIAPDILPSKVAAILASHPSSCIWSRRYFPMKYHYDCDSSGPPLDIKRV